MPVLSAGDESEGVWTVRGEIVPAVNMGETEHQQPQQPQQQAPPTVAASA